MSNLMDKASTDRAAQAISQAVKAALAQAGLTQRDAAALAGITINTFNRRMTGQLQFTYPELVAIATVTDVTTEELVATAEKIARRSALSRVEATA